MNILFMEKIKFNKTIDNCTRKVSLSPVHISIPKKNQSERNSATRYQINVPISFPNLETRHKFFISNFPEKENSKIDSKSQLKTPIYNKSLFSNEMRGKDNEKIIIASKQIHIDNTEYNIELSKFNRYNNKKFNYFCSGKRNKF